MCCWRNVARLQIHGKFCSLRNLLHKIIITLWSWILRLLTCPMDRHDVVMFLKKLAPSLCCIVRFLASWLLMFAGALFWQDVYTYTSYRKKIQICREMKDYIHTYLLYYSTIIEPQFWQNLHTGKRPSHRNSQKSAPPLFWIWYILASCLLRMSADPLFSQYPRAGTHTHTHTQTHALTHTVEVGIAVHSVLLLDDIFICGHIRLICGYIRLICGCIRLQIPCSEGIHARENAQVTVENSAVIHFGNIRKGVRLLGTAW